jgi:ribosomal protein S18 acetylase RimI-like enzyme
MRPAAFRIAPVATPEDLAAAVELFRANAAGLEVDLAYQDFAAELARLPGKYAPPAGALLLARGRAGEPVGCVALRTLGPGVGEMKRLYVLPSARGLGLGRALVDAVVAAARERGCREIRLDTLPSMAEATALYRSAGFDPIPAYYRTPVAGTLFFARALDRETAG